MVKVHFTHLNFGDFYCMMNVSNLILGRYSFYQYENGSGGVGCLLFTPVCLPVSVFLRTISQKLMYIRSPNLT